MLIDWFTVGAQVFNFLVLIYLLKRFLYGPILRAMDRREQSIADRLAEAEAKLTEAAGEAESYRGQLRQLEEERAKRLREADEEAARRRKELLGEARAEVEAAREAWRTSLRREQRLFAEELKKRTAAEVLRTARKVLADLTAAPDLADDELGRRLAARFARHLEELGDEDRERFARAAGAGEVVVRSSFALDRELRSRIAAAVRAAGSAGETRFEEAPERAFGIDLTAGGLRMDWGVAGHLDALEQAVSEVLEGAAGPGPEGAP